jgi:hypothetical protein
MASKKRWIKKSILNWDLQSRLSKSPKYTAGQFTPFVRAAYIDIAKMAAVEIARKTRSEVIELPLIFSGHIGASWHPNSFLTRQSLL